MPAASFFPEKICGLSRGDFFGSNIGDVGCSRVNINYLCLTYLSAIARVIYVVDRFMSLLVADKWQKMSKDELFGSRYMHIVLSFDLEMVTGY